MRIGVLVNNIDGRYQTQILRGIQDFGRLHGAQNVIFSGRSIQSPFPDDALHNAVYQQALGAKLDGYLVVAGAIGTNSDDEQLTQALEAFLARPLVTIGRRLPGIPGVISEDGEGVAEALDHLVLVHGCHQIAFLSGPAHDPSSRVRLAAYRAGLERHDLAYRSDLVYWGDYSYQCCPEIARAMLRSGPLPFDALVCANDEMAVGVQNLLAQAGFRAPQDYALVGFDDLPAFTLRSPGLTTIRQPMYEQTMAAGEHLVHQIRGTPRPALVDLPSAFVCRETCGCSMIPVVGRRRWRGKIPDATTHRLETTAFLEAFFRKVRLAPECRHEIEQLVPALLGVLSLDLRTHRDNPLFLQGLNEWLELTFAWERYAETWSALVSHFREAMAGTEGALGDLSYRNALLLGAETLLARRADQKEARRIAEAADQAAQFRWFSRQLAQAHRSSEVLAILNATVPHLGVDQATLEAEPPCPPKGEVVYLPLVAQGRSFGLLKACGVGVEPLVYATIQEEVAQALFQCALAEERMRSEDRYRDIAQLVPLLMWETDSRLVVTYCNKAATASLGLTEGESLKLLIHPADRSRLDTILAQTGEPGSVSRPGIRLNNKGGTATIRVLQLNPVKSEGQGQVGLRWHALDPIPFALETTLPDTRVLERYQVSEREREVLVLILYGLRSREIAERLDIAESTVKGHVSRLFDKFGVDSRQALLDRIQTHQIERHGHSEYLLMVLNRLLADTPT